MNGEVGCQENSLHHNSANLLSEERRLDNFFGPLSFMFQLRKQVSNYISQDVGWRHGFKQEMTGKLDLCFLFCQKEVIDTHIQAMFEIIQVLNLKCFGQLPIKFSSNLYKKFGAFTKANSLSHFRYFNINQQVDETHFILDFRFIVLLEKLIKRVVT